MAGFKETSCRLCLNNIKDKGFQMVDDVTRNIIDALLLKLKFYGDCKEVICNICTRKLNAAYVFKFMCLNTNNTIISHADGEKMLQLDLGGIYLKQKGSEHVTGILYNHKICRLCMQLIKSEIRHIGEVELEAIHKLLPEMNITIVKDPVLCKPCFDALCIHNNFLKDCLEVEQRIGDNLERLATESQTDTSSDLFIKTENFDEISDINEEDMSIKTEYVDIKLEDKEGSDGMLPCSSSEIFENGDCSNTEEESVWNHNSSSINKCDIDIDEKDAFTFQQFPLDNSLHEWDTGSKNHSSANFMRPKNVSEEYKCEICDYITKKKALLRSHRLRHKHPSEVRMYKCTHCDYTTKYRNTLARHILQHKDPSQVQMYKCDACDYQSKYKHGFIKHQLIHKDPLEVQMYKCDDCDYKTKYKDRLAYHVLQHKDTSQVRMYKCDSCDFESKYRYNLTKHKVTHKDPSKVQMYRCNECDYATKYKRGLAYHALQHKDPSQVQMYKCDACDFESRYKNSLANHQLKHKDPLEVQMYKCSDCDYKTKLKCRLGYHALKHKDPSLVRMYRCNTCNFQTKYKRSLLCHELGHKTDPQNFKCDQCDYETMHKFNLERHQRTHN